VPVKKIAISLPEELADRAREEAAREGLPLSQWMAEAVARKVRDAAALEALRMYEEEFGEISNEEMRELTSEWPCRRWMPAHSSRPSVTTALSGAIGSARSR
jgi:hypothetical protein